MTSHHDKANPPPNLTLLEELEIIDAAYADATVTPEQERRGAEIVALCNSAEDLKAQVERLKKDLDTSRSYSRFLEKERRKKTVTESAFKDIDAIYRSIKEAAEADIQEPIDEHFRECLYGLEAIAADPQACTCASRGWHGEGHDSQCPVTIALRAIEQSRKGLQAGLRARYPLNYEQAPQPKTLPKHVQPDLLANHQPSSVQFSDNEPEAV